MQPARQPQRILDAQLIPIIRKRKNGYVANTTAPLDHTQPLVAFLFNFDTMLRHLDSAQSKRLELFFDNAEVSRAKGIIKTFARAYGGSVDFLATIHHFAESISHLSDLELYQLQPILDEDDVSFAKGLMMSFVETYRNSEDYILAAGEKKRAIGVPNSPQLPAYMEFD